MCAQNAKENALAQPEIVRLMTEKDFKNVSFQNMSPVSLAIYVRQLLQNWRQGTVGCKGRSDVSYANRKPWKQKGTGRARAGSARSPLWRGGGVIFGPQPRVRTLKSSKQLRKNVLGGVFDQYLKKNKIFILDWSLESNLPKTSAAFNALIKANLSHSKSILFLASDDVVHYASFVNIANINIVFFDQPNAYALSFGKNWIILQKDLQAFKDMVQKWI